MKYNLRIFGFGLWLVSGVGVAWMAESESLGVMSLLIIVYGLAMSFLGFVLSLSHTDERDRAANEARLRLQKEYQNATFQQAINIRKAMLYLTNASLSRASGRMIAELLPKFGNEEQLDAAIVRATEIVDDEMKELHELVESEERK